MNFKGKFKNSRGEIVEFKNGGDLRSAMKTSVQQDRAISGLADDLMAKNDSLAFRSYLESEGLTVKDAIRALGIDKIDAHQVRELYANDNTKPLFNAVLEDGFRQGYEAAGRAGELVAKTITMDQMSYQYYYRETGENDELDMKLIGQGAPIPVATIKLNQDKTIFVHKRGAGIEITDEARSMRFDLLALHLLERGRQIGRTDEKVAIHRLLNGYFKDGFDAPKTMGVKTANDWKLSDIWYASQSHNQDYGLSFNRCVMNLKTAEAWATQKEANGTLIFMNELKQGDMPNVLNTTPFISDQIPDNRIMLVDTTSALAEYSFKPFSVENERNVKTQVEGSYATKTSDYVPFNPDARLVLTLDAAR